jgi:glutamine amidotransferase
VGYQLLFEGSEEDGETAGLGLLPGRVTRLPAGVPWPHIGWNRLHGVARASREEGRGGGIGTGEPTAAEWVAGLAEGSWVYFVHGYAPEGVPADAVLAQATHGRAFPAIAGRGRVMGTQFHPERSGAVGLSLLARFVALAGGGEATCSIAAPESARHGAAREAEVGLEGAGRRGASAGDAAPEGRSR